MERKKNYGIQLLRIAACFAVFIVHVGQRMDLPATWQAVTDCGRFGTRLFFLISGYLATKTITEKQNFNVIDYYKKRTIRILPLYYVVILFFFVTETFVWRQIPADSLKLGWARYVFILNGIVGADNTFWSNLGATWTIPVFCFFYLIIPWVLRIVNNLGKTIAVFAFSATVSIICLKYCNGYLLAMRKLPIFILGIVVYRLNTRSEKCWYTIAATAAIVGMLFAKINPSYCVVMGLSVVLLWVPEINFDFSERGAKVIDVLDEHSYTLYLAHAIVLLGFIDKVYLPIKYRFAVIIVCSVALTYLIHKFIEKPIQNYLNDRLLKKQEAN